MTIYKCDRCGKEVEGREYLSTICRVEICDECYNHLKEWLRMLRVDKDVSITPKTKIIS